MPRTGATFINSSSKDTSKNLLINGQMAISQRGSNVPLTGGFTFLLDRWIGWAPSFASHTAPFMAQSSLPAGFPGLPSTAVAQRLFTTPNAAPAALNRVQRIESRNLTPQLRNTVSFGFWLWSSNFQDLTIQLLQPTTGIADDWATSAIIPGGNVSFVGAVPNTGWQYWKIEDVALTNLHGLEVRASLGNPVAIGVGADTYMTEAMCNWGPKVQPFRLMGDNDQEERSLAYRYYEIFAAFDQHNVGTGGGSGIIFDAWTGRSIRDWQWFDRKRVQPAVQVYSSVNGAAGFLGDDGVNRSCQVIPIGTGGFYIEGTGGGFPVGDDMSGYVVGDAEL